MSRGDRSQDRSLLPRTGRRSATARFPDIQHPRLRQGKRVRNGFACGARQAAIHRHGHTATSKRVNSLTDGDGPQAVIRPLSGLATIRDLQSRGRPGQPADLHGWPLLDDLAWDDYRACWFASAERYARRIGRRSRRSTGSSAAASCRSRRPSPASCGSSTAWARRRPRRALRRRRPGFRAERALTRYALPVRMRIATSLTVCRYWGRKNGPTGSAPPMLLPPTPKRDLPSPAL